MPPRPRRTSPAAAATPPKKKAAAKKATPKPPQVDVPHHSDVDVADTAPAAPAVTRAAGRVTARSCSEDSQTTTSGWGDGVEVVTTTDQRSSRTTEYGPGHTVTETTTTSTVRAERIPIPYAGPASDHPAPVG